MPHTFDEIVIPPANPWLAQFDDRLATLADAQVAIRRHLHTHPEPSGEEVETSRFIAEKLRSVGLEPFIGRSDRDVPTGVRVDLDVGAVGPHTPRIAIRCDIDALRMSDAKTVAYRSQRDGVAHCCGHDAHTAIVLGAGLAAAANDGQVAREDVAMRLRLIFQPCEEDDGGAEWMVAQGAMEGVDAILGLHVDPERTAGRVGIRYGVLTAHCDEVAITVQGRGGHAARPHHTVDPVAAAAHLVGALYEFLPRRVDSRHPAVFTIGRIQGGAAANVIPDRVELAGTLRTTDETSRNVLKLEIDRICAATELSTGTQVLRRIFNPLGSVVNDPKCASALERASQDVLGEGRIDRILLPSMGGEDFSVYLPHAPGAMLRLGCGRPDGNSPYLHSPLFDIDERVLQLGSRILVRAALYLTQDLSR